MILGGESLTLADFPPETKWFHGGPLRAGKGGWIMSAASVGLSGRNTFADTYEADKVYVTTDKALAIRFAAKVLRFEGAVFEVEPIGPISSDPGEGPSAFTCNSARVIRRIRIPGKLLKRERKRWIELANEMLREGMLHETDRDAALMSLHRIAERIATRRS